jgi:sodium transport system permease protein
MRALVAAVFRKELKDHLRDRRSLLSVVSGSLVGPLIFGVMFTVMAGWNRQDKPVELPVVGREHAPSLVAYLERMGAKLTEPPADYEAQVKAGKLDAVLIIPEGYGKDFTVGRTAAVRLVVDHSRNNARMRVMRIQRLLQGYAGLLAAQRLMARGVAPELASPVRVDEVDLATPERLAATLLTMIPLFLVFAAFMGGMNVAIDTTAGERERGSLEPLLLNPVQRGALVVGKWLATAVFAGVMVGACLVAFLVVVRRVPLQDLGVKVRMDGGTVAGMLGAVVPLALLASSVQMLVATFARSFKEAQTYLQMMMLLPMVPAMLLLLMPVQGKTWMFALPLLGQELLVGELMRGEPVGAVPFLLGAASSGVLTAVCLWLTARLLGDERIVFGRS